MKFQTLGRAIAAGVVVAATLLTVSSSQAQPVLPAERGRDFMLLRGPGSYIGVSVRDLEGSEGTDRSGVVVEDVRPSSPAEKAGLRRQDLITRYDGETVRGARQFASLVAETPPNRTVKATVVRENKAIDISLVPQARAPLEMSRRIRDDMLEHVRRGLRLDIDRSADFLARGRLGLSLQTLTPQLATYFGAKGGALIASVVDDSPASRAGLRAGDIVTAIDGNAVGTPADVLRELRTATPGTLKLEIVRDKKEMTVIVSR
jgi:serine protease Do